jgi:hypothetical protein
MADEEGLLNGSFIFEDGSKYEGEYSLVNEMKIRSGKGVYSSGPEQYDGYWSNDKMSGTGVYKFANGAVYVGEFQDGMFNGQVFLIIWTKRCLLLRIENSKK